jgi:hypothetical protein
MDNPYIQEKRVTTKNVFWSVTPNSLVEVYWRFEGIYYLHHQDRRGILKILSSDM